MIKRTLYFGNPCKLSLKEGQLHIDYTGDESSKSVPVEDTGVIVLDNTQVVLTAALMMALMENNAAVLICNSRHLPDALLLRMHEHHAFTETVRCQVESSEPLRKNLWQQTVAAKIKNQAALLEFTGIEAKNMNYWAGSVRSGDPDNYEARAASFYWSALYGSESGFRRHRHGEPPNNLLNYGYALLRAVVARSLVASGLMSFLGIHHRNKYNPYCLADDIMEPYRPFVDRITMAIAEDFEDIEELTPEIKKRLLIIPSADVMIDGSTSPLMIAAQRTTASLIKCYAGESRKLLFPVLK
ncbi:MAG TPA: type II CRISPR-associated endonuclease Cas1 [Bacteroidales bacterium]|nr:type II CRISPR-associated endonuclease Cas1 [Bacteroidales bacterium]